MIDVMNENDETETEGDSADALHYLLVSVC